MSVSRSEAHRQVTILGDGPRKHRLLAGLVSTSVLVALIQLPAGATAQENVASDQASAEQRQPRSFDEVTVAAARARETGVRQELRSARNATSTTFVDPDGSTTTEVTQSPTRTKVDGEWVDIDPSLERVDGLLVPEATKADVKISDGRGSESLATVIKGTASLSLDWATDLPPAQVHGAGATFEAGSSREVQVTATNDGFNLRVVLDKVPTVAPVYRIPVRTEGVRLAETADGGFAANNEVGTVIFRIAPPLMWDATQDGLEAGPEITEPVDAEVIEGADAGPRQS